MAKKIARPSRPAHKSPAQAEEQKPGKGGKKTFDNTNRGALFINEKDGNENRPDYTGLADIEIPEGAKSGDVIKFRIAGWKKVAANSGNTFLSLTVQKSEPKPEQGSKGSGNF